MFVLSAVIARFNEFISIVYTHQNALIQFIRFRAFLLYLSKQRSPQNLLRNKSLCIPPKSLWKCYNNLNRINEMLDKKKKLLKKIFVISLLGLAIIFGVLAFVGSFYSSAFFNDTTMFVFFFLSLASLATVLLLTFIHQRKDISVRTSSFDLPFSVLRYVFEIMALCSMIAIIVLEALPDGVMMQFSRVNEGGEIVLVASYYPYFSSMVFGYGVLPAILCVLTSIALLAQLILVVVFAKKRSLLIGAIVLSGLLFIWSLLQLFFSQTIINYCLIGLSFLSTGLLVSALLLKKKTKTTSNF